MIPPRTATLVHLAAALAMSSACAVRASAQEKSEAFVQWAKVHAVPLRTVETERDDSDLRPLVAMVGTARVVALGEAAHGAHEPLALRNRLFRFLVERMGFTAIAIESGLTESQRVQEFVGGGAGSARQVVHDDLTWGFGDFTENVELVQWMHDFNLDPAHSRKIRFYGVDLSAGAGGAIASARIAIDEAVAFIARTDTASAKRLRLQFEPYLERFSSAGYAALAPAERDGLSAAIVALGSVLQRGRPAFVASTSATDYEWALRNVAVARQLDAFFRVAPPTTADAAIPPTLYRAMNVRDSAMAANLEWVLEREGPAGRVMLFAHDAHVMNGTLKGPLWQAFAEAPTQMGVHLKRRLARELFTIATSSANNAADISKATLDSTGIDAALARVGVPLFLLDLRGAAQNPGAAAWLAQTHTLRVNFDVHADVTAATAFDALLYIDTLTKTKAQP